MNSSKQIITIISGMLLYGTSISQIVYKDFVPDKVYEMPANSYNSFPFDVDGDNVDDFNFVYYNYPGSIVDVAIDRVKGSDPKIETAYDNTKPKSPIGTYYVEKIGFNELISSASLFSDDFPIIGDIYDPHFLYETDKYIGFRLVKGPDNYKYGWMLVELEGSDNITFTVKELAYQNTKNTPIKAGQKSIVGISEVSMTEAGFQMITDRGNQQLRISNSDGQREANIQIYSMQGQQLIERMNESLPTQIGISSLSNGAYIVVVSNENGRYSEKMLK